MKKNVPKITEQLHRIFNKAIDKEMVPRTLDSGELLYRIELHVIVAIAEHPEINLTELSEILGVTKGAVSQKIKILEKKKYLERYKKKENNKEILFRLTENGKRIYYAHQGFHKQFNDKIRKVLGDIDDNNLRKIIETLNIIEHYFETI